MAETFPILITVAPADTGKRLDQFLQGVNRNTIRGSAALFVLPRRLTLQSSAAYDLLTPRALEFEDRLAEGSLIDLKLTSKQAAAKIDVFL